MRRSIPPLYLYRKYQSGASSQSAQLSIKWDKWDHFKILLKNLLQNYKEHKQHLTLVIYDSQVL